MRRSACWWWWSGPGSLRVVLLCLAYVYSVNVYRHSVAHKCAEWPPHHTDVCSLSLVCKLMLSASSLQLLCNVCHRLDSADGFCCGANGAVGLRLGHQPCPGALVTLSAARSSALISEMQACVQLSTNSASSTCLCFIHAALRELPRSRHLKRFLLALSCRFNRCSSSRRRRPQVQQQSSRTRRKSEP